MARTVTDTLPQYTNDDETAEYWYENVKGNTYLAVQLKVLEVDVEEGINRLELAEHSILKDLRIIKFKQNTNYKVDENIKVIDIGKKSFLNP
ncbi:hypothetical protein [Lysinibacillus sp. RC79]|uniref:hypothetical protein n=1 Tax=Lysinibacillus sp. RC79 TaxID=3156296 RepID=UPI003515F1D4